jgi:hypothetical protein
MTIKPTNPPRSLAVVDSLSEVLTDQHADEHHVIILAALLHLLGEYMAAASVTSSPDEIDKSIAFVVSELRGAIATAQRARRGKQCHGKCE